MSRLNKLRNELIKNNLDGMFVFSEANVTYISRFTGESSILFLTNEKCILITDRRYIEQAETETDEEIECMIWIEDKRYGIETYKYLTEDKKIKKVGFENQIILYKDYIILKKLSNVELIPFSGIIENLRAQKDNDEIGFLKKACTISDKALELTLPFIKEGVSELDICAQLEYNLKTNGADNISFDTLVLSGEKSSMLHGKPGTKKLKNSDMILFDFGALYSGYHADISRVFILGKVNKEQKELYEIIKTAQQSSLESLQPGISGVVPNDAAIANIPEKYIPYYYPRMGHGVGLQIHEAPFLGEGSDAIIKENMVLTIEPGIYLPGWGGIRIEDTVRITENSYESLSSFPRELIIL